MPGEVYEEALQAYVNPFQKFTVKPLRQGLINESFKISSQSSHESFLLQRINRKVFADPEKVQQNYIAIWKYITSEYIDFYLPEPKYFTDTDSLFCDSLNNYWRVFEFVENSYTPKSIRSQIAKETACVFAEFTACLKKFEEKQLHIVIPDFHNLALRFRQFQESCASLIKERVEKASTLIDQLKSRERYASFYDVITESEEFPRRIMHHDAKLSNVLYDKADGKLICPVDFDTTMPGYFFSDVGDMIRTMSCTVDENSIEFNKITVRRKFYRAIISGYLEAMENLLTPSEKKYIHYSGLILTYMQALRFMADYLNGDVYYKITHDEQNLDRAKNQFTLLQRLEDFIRTDYSLSL
jgi:hypothetical protein